MYHIFISYNRFMSWCYVCSVVIAEFYFSWCECVANLRMAVATVRSLDDLPDGKRVVEVILYEIPEGSLFSINVIYCLMVHTGIMRFVSGLLAERWPWCFKWTSRSSNRRLRTGVEITWYLMLISALDSVSNVLWNLKKNDTRYILLILILIVL